MSLENWMRAEVGRLRRKAKELEDKAQGLEVLLVEYEQSASPKSAPSPAENKPSRFAYLQEQIAKSSDGLTLDALIEIAKSAGYTSERNALRTQLAIAVKKGGLVRVGENYRIPNG